MAILLFLVVIAVNLPFVHTLITSKVNAILVEKNIPVRIGKISFLINGNIGVNELEMITNGNDTIVYAEKIRIDVSLPALISKKVIVNNVRLTNAVVNILTDPETGEINLVSAFGTKNSTAPVEEPAKKETDNSWEIIAEKALLQNIRFKYSDVAGGILVEQSLAKASIVLREMSLIKQQIDIKSVEIDKPVGLVGVWEGKVKEENETESSTAWNFSAGEIKFNDLDFTLDQPDSGSEIKVTLKNGEILTAGVNLLTSEISVDKIGLNSPGITFVQDSVVNETAPKQENQSTSFSLPMLSWNISNQKLEINHGFLNMENKTAASPDTANQWLPVTGLNVTIENTGIAPSGYKTNLSEISFALAKSMALESGKLNFSYDSSNNISLASALSAVPLQKTGWLEEQEKFELLVKIDGDTSALNIDNIEFISSSGPQFNLNGSLSSPFHLSKSVCDIRFATNTITRAQLSKVIQTFNPEVKLPEFEPVILKGSIQNTINNPYFDIYAGSKTGQIKAKGNYRVQQTKGKIELELTEVRLQDLLGEKYPEHLTGKVLAEGGMNKNKIPEGMVNVEIDSVGFRGKTYQHITFEAQTENNEADFSGIIADNSLKFNIKGLFNWTEKKQYSGWVKGDFDADLYEMNLVQNPFSGKIKLDVGFDYAPEEIQAKAKIKDVYIVNSKSSETIDSLVFDFASSTTGIKSEINSDFFTASFTSYTPLSDLLGAIDSIRINPELKSDSASLIQLGPVAALDFLNLDATLRYDSVFRLFYPDSVLNFSDIKLNISKVDKDSIFKGSIFASRLKFQKAESINNNIVASLTDDKLSLELTLEDIVDEKTKFGELGLSLNVIANSTQGNFYVKNEEGDLIDALGFYTEKNNDALVFKSSEEDWIFNSKPWSLSPPEFLTWNRKANSFTANLELQHNDQYIRVKGKDTELIEFSLKNVELGDFIIPGLYSYVPQGLLNGNASYRKSDTQNVEMDLSIGNFKWRSIDIQLIETKGHLIADSTGIKEAELNLNADDSTSLMLSLQTNSIKNEIQINTQFKKLNFSLLGPFINTFANNLHGTTDGEINFSKTKQTQDLNGEIRFNDFGLRIKPLQARLTIPDNKIVLDRNKLIFRNFTVIDSLKRPLTVNGNIDFFDTDNILIDLNVKAEKIQLMNTAYSQNAPLYGSVVINSGLDISGSLQKPVIRGDIGLVEGTNLTYQLIQDLSVGASQTDVVFANITDSLKVIYPESGKIKRVTKMPNIETAITIDPKSILNVKIEDLYNVDISINGNGLLNYNMLPNNTMSMNGVYTINEGKCQLKITGWPLKNFNITPGSSFNWNGTVENPELNLEATSKVRGSYVNPLDNKTRVVDFVVTMQFKNQLSELDINFGISSTDQYITSVLNSLSSDEMMRQSINLLLFSTIEIPGIQNSSNYLASQISSFWESQINAIASDNMSKTKLSFGIDTYNNSSAQGAGSEKTSITYEMERKFLDDRVTVKLSGKLNDYNEGKYQTNSLFENFIVEYALDSLNTKNIKLYQKRDYEDMLEGEVVKYGVGFLYRKNYRKLSDIWRRKKNRTVSNENNIAGSE